MNPLVVLFALAAVTCGSASLLLAQPAHHPAVVLDPHGRPLDTADVIVARAIHYQAKALEGHYEHHAPLVHSIAPYSIAAPWFGAHGHLLKKRSLGHYVHAAPLVHHAIAPSAVSHQSRVDVISSPAVVSHAVAAPAVVAYAAPVHHAVAPVAVSHQSRVDVHSSPAVVAHATPYVAHAAPIVAHAAPIVHHAIAPAAVSHQSRVDVHSAHAVHAAPSWGLSSLWGSHSAHDLSAHSAHGIWKRSLGFFGHAIAPAAVSHQSRVDIVSSPAVVAHAAPYVAHASPVVHHAIAPVAVSHQSRVDVHSSPAVVSHVAPLAHSYAHSYAPLAHSYAHSYAPLSHSVHAPLAHYSHHGLHGSPLVHAW